MWVETNVSPVDTFEVSINITEASNKTEIHNTNYDFTTFPPFTLEIPGMEEQRCMRPIEDDSHCEPIIDENGVNFSLFEEGVKKTVKSGGHDKSHCTKPEVDHPVHSIHEGVKVTHGDLSLQEAVDRSCPESYATKMTGPFGHPSTAQDPTNAVWKEPDARAGFGCGLVVGLAAVHRPGTMWTDLPKHYSSPECPSNFDCTLSFDTDIDPEDSGCGCASQRAANKHGVVNRVYTTIHGMTKAKNVSKDAGCAEKAFPDAANKRRNVTFDQPFNNDKAMTMNASKYAFVTKEPEISFDKYHCDITKHVKTSEGIACGIGTYVRGPTTLCDLTTDRALALIVDDFDPFNMKIVAIQHVRDATEIMGSTKTDPSGSSISIEQKEVAKNTCSI